jgi:hypothetical protein
MDHAIRPCLAGRLIQRNDGFLAAYASLFKGLQSQLYQYHSPLIFIIYICFIQKK